MKNKKLNKLYILGIIAFLVVIVSSIFFSINKNSDPFEFVRERRSNMVENLELISIEETKDGVMVYSVGKVNNAMDNMYFIDMVKKSFVGYKWLGGGGHINREREYKNFIFSAQLLNEDQNINPTLFGILLDENISQIAVRTRYGLSRSIIYDGKDGNEKFYVIPFENNVSNEYCFIFTVSYKDGKELEFLINDKIDRFQEGISRYFYEADIN